MSINWEQHNGKEYLYINYGGLDPKETIKIVREQAEIMRKCSSPILILVNISNATGSQEFMAEAKKLGKEVFNPMTKKSAIFGVTGLKKILLQGYISFTNSKFAVFDNKEQAMEYLVSP